MLIVYYVALLMMKLLKITEVTVGFIISIKLIT